MRATVQDVGEVVSYDDYDPWGLILNGRSMTAQANLPNKFTGKEWDDDFGLNWNYFGARYYDSIVCEGRIRFTSVQKYGAPPMSLVHEGGIFTTATLPYNSSKAKALKKLNRQVIKSFGLVKGVTHTEFIRGKKDSVFYFLETAARINDAVQAAFLADSRITRSPGSRCSTVKACPATDAASARTGFSFQSRCNCKNVFAMFAWFRFSTT